MSKKYSKLKTYIITAILCILFTTPVLAATRHTDVTKPTEGNVLFAIQGTFSTATKHNALKRINEIRLEACKQGVPNPSTGKALTTADYVPIKWSSDLEWIAQTRAAEAAIMHSHTRPNNLICSSLHHNEIGSYGEVLAWNWDGMMMGIEQWYSEKYDWVNHNYNAVTGHYTSLINPANTYVGLGTFSLTTFSPFSVAGEFSRQSNLNEDKIGVTGKYTQIIEVPVSSVSITLPKNISLGFGNSKKISIPATAIFNDDFGEPKPIEGHIAGPIMWKSGNPDIVSINNNGTITAKNFGKADIFAEVSGLSARTTVKVLFSITYNLNGGKNNKSNPDCYSAKTVLKKPTRKKYTFVGWYKESNFKTKVTALTSGNHVLYARWRKVTVGKGKTPGLKKISDTKIKISYASVKKAAGYQIQYSTRKNFKKNVKKTISKGRSKTYTLSPKNKYYFRVRAYKLDSTGAKIFGKWSKAKAKNI